MPPAAAPRPSIRLAAILQAIQQSYRELMLAGDALDEHRTHVNAGFVRASLSRAIDKARWAEELATSLEREQARDRRGAMPLFTTPRG